MAVAVRSPLKPAGAWPWKQSGAYWIMRFPLSGPVSAFVPASYSPITNWSRGWPMTLRRQVFLAALLFSIIATGITLWRSRWAVALFVAISMCCVGVVCAWRARQPVMLEASGGILISNPVGMQNDRWTYCTVIRNAEQTIEWHDLSHPVFATRAQIAQMPVRLVCAENGEPQAFRTSLEPGRSLAFLERSISQLRPLISPSLPITSPMQSLAVDLYEQPGDVTTGQVVDDASPIRWPAVCIDSTRQ